MSRRHSKIPAMVSLLLAALTAPLMGMSAPAEDSQKASFTPREMAHCMMKRFKARHSESYRDAYNACKEQFDLAQTDRYETAMNDPAPEEASRPQ